jgi:hypothetical protein
MEGLHLGRFDKETFHLITIDWCFISFFFKKNAFKFYLKFGWCVKGEKGNLKGIKQDKLENIEGSV